MIFKPIIITVKCINNNKTFDIYSLCEDASLFEIRFEVTQQIKKRYGNYAKFLTFEISTNYNFTDFIEQSKFEL